MIRVQREDFDIGAEIAGLTDGRTDIGGLCTFVGLVRDMAGDKRIDAMTLEHYPGMTEKQLAWIETDARRRWPLFDVLIIHRYGRMEPGERIVMVATTSVHREAAIRACEFLIDWLKTKAPFWKLEERETGAQWVDAKESDDAAAEKWETAEDPLADPIGTVVDKLLARGEKRGYVTYDELNTALPPNEVTSEQIENVMARLSELGVSVVENDSD